MIASTASRRIARLAVALATVAVSLAGTAPAARAAVPVTCPGQSLQAAITAAAPGETINLTGTCMEAVDIDKDVTIVGTGASSAIIDATGQNQSAVDILNDASVTLSDVKITGGSTTGFSDFGGGIDDNEGSGTLTITNSLITGNNTSTEGGGIWASGTLILDSSTVSQNSATQSGGGLFVSGTTTITDSAITINDTEGFGGGIDNFGGTITITDSTISFNTTPLFGGGLFNEGAFADATIVGSTFNDNSAGADVLSRPALFTGGAIDNDRGTLVIRNSTITANTSGPLADDAGGIWSSGTATLEHVTVAGNTGNVGGVFSDGAPNAFTVTSSIIATNSGAAPDCKGKVVSGGGNLIGDVTGCPITAQANDLFGTAGSPIDPLLGPLADNGGPTKSMALLAGSPARDRAPGPCTLGTDQRGFARPQGSGCDSGAYEATDQAPVAVNDAYVTTAGTALVVAAPGVLSNDSDPNSEPLTAAKVSDPAHGSVALSTDGSFTYTPAAGFAGTDSFTYRASDGVLSSNEATVLITVTAPPPPPPSDDNTVGLVDVTQGKWYLRNSAGVVTSFFYGNPVDLPIAGDWDGDGDATPGLYRQSDGFFYARNSNTQGPADDTCFAGDPSDIPIVGDWDGDGDDNLGIYRPSTQTFYLFTITCTGSPMGAAQISLLFGNPGDKPVAGDWDGDGRDDIGLHRESTGFFYWRNTLTTGVADGEIFFGDPNDRFVSGDWGTVDGVDSPAIFRPSTATFYFRHTLTQGNADSSFPWAGAGSTWLPVAGFFGLG